MPVSLRLARGLLVAAAAGSALFVGGDWFGLPGICGALVAISLGGCGWGLLAERARRDGVVRLRVTPGGVRSVGQAQRAEQPVEVVRVVPHWAGITLAYRYGSPTAVERRLTIWKHTLEPDPFRRLTVMLRGLSRALA